MPAPQEGESFFRWAVIASAAGFALLVLGLISYVYYGEQILIRASSHLSTSDLTSISNVAKLSVSATALGDLFAVLGIVFIYQGVIRRLKHTEGSVLMGQLHLTGIKMLTIVALIILLISASLRIWIEIGNDIGNGMGLRIYYLAMIPWVLLAAALLITAVDLAKKPDVRQLLTPAVKRD